MIRARGLATTPLRVQGGIVEFVRPGEHVTFTPGGTIVGGQVVKLSANRTVIITAAVTDKAVGVALYNAASTDGSVTCATDGVYPCTANGAVTFNDDLTPNAAGAVSTLAAGATTDQVRTIMGRAYESITTATTGRVKLRMI
jgi:hypothetical protein